MKFLFAVVIAGLVVLGRAEPASVSLESMLELAQQRNPDIRAIRASVEALRSRPQSVRAWDNPVLGYSKEDEPGGGEVTHWRGEQDIPFPGKRTSEGDTAVHEAEALEAEALAKSLSVRAQVRSLLFRLHRTQEMARILSEQIGIVDALIGSVRGRLSRVPGNVPMTGSPGSAGMGGAGARDGGSAYFALESERTRLVNALLLEKQEYRSSAMELNALLDRPLKTPIEPFRLPAPALPKETVGQLYERALQSGPTLLRSLQEEQAAQARLKRARLSFAPDFSVMYDWMKDEEGMTGSETRISASVPLWWNRPRGERLEAQSALLSAQHSAHAMGIELERTVTTAFEEVETRLTVLRNIETALIPSARSAFNIERARFESGRGEVIVFLETFRGVLMGEMEYQRALEEFAAQWGALEQGVGGAVALGRTKENKK